jgi:thioredoxin 1
MAKDVCPSEPGLSGDDNMAYIELTDATFQDEVLKNKQPVLVEFSAKWSGSCHIIAPALKEMGEKYRPHVKFCRIDVDTHAETATQYGVQRVPTILLFRDGQLVDHIIGITSKNIMAQKLNALLGLTLRDTD